MDKQQRRAILGETLTALRVSAGLNQTDVALRLGKPQSFVSKYESAERRIDLPDLEEIVAAIGTSLEDAISHYRKAIDAS